MAVFNANDRVIHDNGQYGIVIHWYWPIGEYIPVKFDDGTIKTVHRCYLTKLNDYIANLTRKE